MAWSWKTSYLLKDLHEDKRSLILTYTIANTKNIYDGIISKFGYFPTNIKLMSYFTFLYSFCFRPYFLKESKAKWISFLPPPDFTRMLKRDNAKFYISTWERIYHNRIAEYILNNWWAIYLQNRLEKYYDKLYIDEVQDIWGYDFSLLEEVVKANIDHLYVWDFFQHTFDTSRDWKMNWGLYKDHKKYLAKCKKIWLSIDTTTLINSHRCNTITCDFIRDKIWIPIFSTSKRSWEIELIDNQESADIIFNDNWIVKLFYQNFHRYSCFSNNWGNCKWVDEYYDVCVVLNPGTMTAFKEDTLNSLPDQTKNKFYVACTRAKWNLYFVADTYYKKYLNNQ